MTPSQQKLDIDKRRGDMHALCQRLQSDIKVLEAGMKYIDEGGNILEDKGVLPSEVRNIMSKRLIDLT